MKYQFTVCYRVQYQGICFLSFAFFEGWSGGPLPWPSHGTARAMAAGTPPT